MNLRQERRGGKGNEEAGENGGSAHRSDDVENLLPSQMDKSKCCNSGVVSTYLQPKYKCLKGV